MIDTDIMTTNDLMAYLKLGRGLIYRIIKTDGFPGFRVGSDWRFRKADVDKWLEGRKNLE